MDANTDRKKVLIIGNSFLVVFKFRKELIEALLAKGCEVWVSFPNGPFGEGENYSKQLGCKFAEVTIDRRGKNPLKDLSLLTQYYRLINKITPDMVLAYTVKPDIYGGIICRILKVPYMVNITGLGKGLVEGKLTKKLTCVLYKIAVKKAKCVFFQNMQDRKYFIDNGIKYPKGCILPGSGVNLKEFVSLPYPDDKKIRFIYIARVMKTKGIEQYLEAAAALKKKYSNLEFHICGYCEEDYELKLREYQKKEIILYHGLVENVIEYVRYCHCIVLPTFHPEGVSNVLLEGAACARPLITTNRAGCRETVLDGITGYLVKERDSNDLIRKMEKFILLPFNEKKKMGEYGRKKIENEFDREIVVKAYLEKIFESRG